jgi:hypothetical protein
LRALAGGLQGERLLVTPTDYKPDNCEERIITSVTSSGTGSLVVVSAPFSVPHWGTLQTYNNTRLAPSVLDERAEVRWLSAMRAPRAHAFALLSLLGSAFTWCAFTRSMGRGQDVVTALPAQCPSASEDVVGSWPAQWVACDQHAEWHTVGLELAAASCGSAVAYTFVPKLLLLLLNAKLW